MPALGFDESLVAAGPSLIGQTKHEERPRQVCQPEGKAAHVTQVTCEVFFARGERPFQKLTASGKIAG